MRAFADTNIAIYAESDDGEKSKRARAIIESSPVISTQVVNEVIAALIVASALESGCDVLYSEDMQDEQVFAERVTARNPFVDQ